MDPAREAGMVRVMRAEGVAVNAINNLALLTGQLGRPGASPFSITGQCNAMGTRETGFTSSLPGYRKFESAEDRAELAGLWNVPVERIPEASLYKFVEFTWNAVTEVAVKK